MITLQRLILGVGRLLYGFAFSDVDPVLVLFDFQADQTCFLFVVNLNIKYSNHSGCFNTNQDNTAEA
jgi:hypothetical protein